MISIIQELFVMLKREMRVIFQIEHESIEQI